MAKDFFSLPEAAAILGISRIAVFKKVRKGQLPALRIGRNWAIAASVLNSYGRVLPPIPKRSVKHHETKTVNYSPPSDKEMNDMGWD